MPNDLKWCQLAQKGDSTPKPRSGHTITWTGSNNYVMYGGIEDPEGMNKVVPNSDVWSMKLMLKECRWEKEQCPGEEGETPPPRTQHVAHCIPNKSAIFVFGGHAGPTQRLNDCWWLKMQDGRPSKWCRVQGCKDVEENKESTISAPPPRANMGSCINGNKIYIYGGHGGLNYQRTAFSDIYSFDIDTCEWKQYEPVVQAQPPPLGRGGNSIFVVDDKLYSYGGWNAESQYTNLLSFDLNTCEWNDPDIFNGVARWNHCAAMVEAIPSWKYFIFGGESTDFGEAQPRTFGGCVSSSCYMDLDSLNWQTIAPEDPECPEPREYSAMAYDERDRRLVIFGGWNNGWMKDLYALDVSKIVGPSYACTHISPPLGQISGGVEITLKGVGFTSNNIQVYFTPGNQISMNISKMALNVTGNWVSENEITAITPDFTVFGEKREATVQLTIAGGDLTTTFVDYHFFLDTMPDKTLCYGPGVLQEMSTKEPVEFIIQARNIEEENRTSGLDEFQVVVKTREEEPVELPCEIRDNMDGKYFVKYHCDRECEVDIDVKYLDSKSRWQSVRGPYTASFTSASDAKVNSLTGPAMSKHITETIARMQSSFKETQDGAKIAGKDVSDVKTLIGVKDCVEYINNEQKSITLTLDQLNESLGFLASNGASKDKEAKQTQKLFDGWTNLKKLAKETKKEIASVVENETKKNVTVINKFEESLKSYTTTEMKRKVFYKYDTGKDAGMASIQSVLADIENFEASLVDLEYTGGKFGQLELLNASKAYIEQIKSEVGSMDTLWTHIGACQDVFDENLGTKWADVKSDDMEDRIKKLLKGLKEMKVDKRCNTYTGILEEIKKWMVFLPLAGQLRDPAMKDRHWQQVKDKAGVEFEINDALKLDFIYDMNLGKIQDDVEEITDQAVQEARMEKQLSAIAEFWKDINFDFTAYKNTGVQMLRLSEENFEALEENQTIVTAMQSSRYLAFFEKDVNKWQTALAQINEVVLLCGEVQRTWSFLENLFIHSEEVKKELPKQSESFIGIDRGVKQILSDGYQKKNALSFCTQDYVFPELEKVQKELTVCEKALFDFMDTKRTAFPRFYFVSQNDLLDILSNGNNPSKVMVHMPKIFQAIETLELKEVAGKDRPFAQGMHTSVGKEYVAFTNELPLAKKVENYLQDVIDSMRGSLRDIASDSRTRFQQKPKEEWLYDDPAQVTLLVNMVNWVINVETAFEQNAMRAAYDDQVKLLTDLIVMVQGDLDGGMRQKIMCMITMDAHSRDIILQLVDQKVDSKEEFQWQSQLKAYWFDELGDYRLNACDASIAYGYEYLGNGPRLVVTPLTDRIYVTATQALHLKMGCAPAGPAGTGKTETTKDLSSACAKAVYVFNCSDQMDYLSMGGIFKGLASSGSWGCFDEFNRLKPSVLSVCSVQFKSVTDAIKQQKQTFILQEDSVTLDPTCGVFITMNPGYLGRAELPEGLKALFRPITVVVPDLELICENMLMAEGFVAAKKLAKKFTTLYALCKDLLSKALHYDWGLRAIKSVLVVAGKFKRAEPELPEPDLLMRALRDFNLPKIVAEDLDIFNGLLGDLFPGLNPVRKQDFDFEDIIKACVEAKGLYSDKDFILKVVQLKELLEIRHCVFVMGPPGAGKSSTWQILSDSFTKSGTKSTVRDLNPKVVSSDELYGVVHPQTREWIDGLMSNTMRALGQVPDTNPKWIVLDGDLDATWIESMNSVMDDNKILTLASNERIPLKSHMRLIFEIKNLKFATPATVSRAGILFISDMAGHQWRAYVKSWLAQFDKEKQKELEGYFTTFIEVALTHIRKSFKYLIPVVEISMVVALCKLLESIMKSHEVKGLAYVFVFCAVWCFGAAFDEKDGKQYRKEFSNWWKDTFKAPRFPTKGTVFDYCVDFQNPNFVEWSTLNTADVSSQIDTSQAIQNFTVPTSDTISTQFLMTKFLKVGHSPLLIGASGCGKTQIIKGLINDLCGNPDEYQQQVINFSYYTDSMLLQAVLESNLEKRAGRTYAPVGKAKLIYFIDDLNMPMLDPFETQSAIALVRQHKDYEHWYDRQKLALKDIKNTLYVSAMNPTAGSFVVNPRLQRHFWTAAIQIPEGPSLNTIFSAYLNKHFGGYKASIQEQIPVIIKATINVHQDVERTFKKTAVNFHYEFNVRHLTNVFQGVLMARQDIIKEPDNLVKLWAHECERIYGDRLVNAEHLAAYKAFCADICKKQFPRVAMTKYYQPTNPEPLVFANFVESLDDKKYDQFPDVAKLTERLTQGLNAYNEFNAVMDLVLFEDAMKHVCKVSRIISNEAGHALLVGVGGSGKQSLARLASNMSNYTVKQIMISSSYGLADLKVDEQDMYMKCGTKDEGITFLFTEGQITNERFLVSLNDLLSSGEIADLFPVEDIDNIVNTVRGAVKSEGIVDSKDNCWKFFLDRVRRNLHMALCFSPVGDAFRNRAKKFPALINSTVIDFFHPWPKEALLSVAARFLEEVEMPSEEVRDAVVRFMPFSFDIVGQQSELIKDEERRYIYTTPKSFLELIKLFKAMLTTKKNYLEDEKTKYEIGVGKLQQTEEIVAQLEADLKIQSIEVEAIKIEANEKATVVGAEKEIVDVKAAQAEKDSAEANKIKDEVETLLSSVQKDLDNAIPLVEKAKAALNALKKEDFQTLKVLGSPPDDIKKTFMAVQHLYSGIDELVPVDKKGKLTLTDLTDSWKLAQKMMGNPVKFMEGLLDYSKNIDEGKVPPQNFKQIKEQVEDPEFTKEALNVKSTAAGGVCDWIKNIYMYYDVVINVEPKRLAVLKGKEDLAAASEKKATSEALVKELNEKLAVLMAEYQEAVDKKQKAEETAAYCAERLSRANRLVGALGAEKERWGNSIIQLGAEVDVVTGDVLMSSAFVSYVGPFSKKFRERIIDQMFMKFFKDNAIPFSDGLDPLRILTNEAEIAQWNNDKLPTDSVSVQNGAILTASERYPLMIDPQLQGIVWIKKKEAANNLQVTRLSNSKMVKTIEYSVEAGQPVLIENLENGIDAVIQPVYSRSITKKGKNKYIKMGDKTLSLHPNFMLYLHTKLQNPHYPPEIQAECTLINFSVTEVGLEDQLLSLVVRKERPDLAAKNEELIQDQNNFKITLGTLEAQTLKQLKEQSGDILADLELIENLENSKAVSTDIKEKVAVAKVTQAQIVESSEAYRPAANRGALVFFLMNELFKIHSFYRFSLDSFVIVVGRAIDIVADRLNPKKQKEAEEPAEGEEGAAAAEGEEAKAEEAAPEADEEEEEEELELTPRSLSARVTQILDQITFEGFSYTRRGTREAHKLIVATMLTLRINIRKELIKEDEVNALIKKVVAMEPPNQIENLKFIPEPAWAACKGLEAVPIFASLLSSMESEAIQWKKWYGDEKAESCELPKSFRDIGLFHRILLLRALRPDRLQAALFQYVTESLGQEYIEQPAFDPFIVYNEMGVKTPAFFVLYPGVDPTPDVERVGQKYNKSLADGTFRNVSMGQGQEKIALNYLIEAAKNGNWVMVQNVHLMTEWMKDFERQLEICQDDDPHPDFRCFISSEPPPMDHQEIIPESILQNAIKVSNEAPTNLKANMRRAISKFDEAYYDKAKEHKYNEFKALIFGLCMFHSLIVGRRKFGSIGWSRIYNFNDGDLTICGDILHNYLSKFEKVPYEDLKYLFGEIMYGGHITDNWDRRTNNTYLQVLIRPEILTQMQLTLYPGFKSPDPAKFERKTYEQYVEEKLPTEVPAMFGLHPNAEIGYLTNLGETIFSIILRISGSGGAGGKSAADVVKELISSFLGQLPESFNIVEITSRYAELTPYLIVSLQETERMNGLIGTIRFSLTELEQGLSGALNITDAMESLLSELARNVVPGSWTGVAYPSLKSLSEWFADLLLRIQQLAEWTETAETPCVVWISALFNPMSYLTAIMQVTAREKVLPLDDIVLRTVIVNQANPEEIKAFAAEGAFVHGFFLEGADWEMGRGDEQGYLVDQTLKELHPAVPVVHVTAIERKDEQTVAIYQCPAYITSARGGTYVFTAGLQLESEEQDIKKWILSGTCLIMQPE